MIQENAIVVLVILQRRRPPLKVALPQCRPPLIVDVKRAAARSQKIIDIDRLVAQR